MDPVVILLLITIVAWVGMEVALILSRNGSISQRIVQFANYYPPIRFLVGLVIGLLCGHLFWQ
jgi:hypothetical protein